MENPHSPHGAAEGEEYSDIEKTIPLYRRAVLKGAAASPLAAAGLTAAGTSFTIDTAAASQTTVLEEGFEGDPVGEYPVTWFNSGNSDAFVVDSPVANGDRAFRTKGQAGGCNESINRHKAHIPLNSRAVITANVLPTSNGGGCHDKNGGITITGGDSLHEGCGTARRLLRFNPDGSLQGSSEPLGTYNRDSWNRVEIEYELSEDGVTLTYTINGESRGSIEKEPTSCELDDQANYISLNSGDFTVYWDDIVVEQGEKEATVTPTKARIIQRVEGTQVIGDDSSAISEFQSGILLNNIETTLVFDFDITNGEEISDTDQFYLRYKRKFTDGTIEQIDETVEISGSDVDKIEGGDKYASAEELINILGDDLPQFTTSQNRNSNTDEFIIEFVPTAESADHITGGQMTVDSPPALAEMPELNIGFISIQDPDSGANYGNEFGRVNQVQYLGLVALTQTYVERTYPTPAVNIYRHPWSDPVIGVRNEEEGDEEHYENLQATRDALEQELDNTNLDRFDVTIAVVPTGYVDYHDIQDNVLGAHPTSHPDHESQPQQSCFVREGVGADTPAMEIGHHFLPHPTYPDVMSRHFINDDTGNTEIDNHHARSFQPDDEPSVIQNTYDLINTPPIADTAVESLMSYSNMDKVWSDASMYNTLIDYSEGHDEWVLAIDEAEGSGSPVLSGMAVENDDSKVQFTRLLKREGDPMPSVSGGNVDFEILDPNDKIIDSITTHNHVSSLFDTEGGVGDGITITNGLIPFTLPFPKETALIQISTPDTKVELNPIERSVRNAIKRIPDNGFINRPDERREALFDKLDAIGRQMDQEKFQAAKETMEEDIRDKFEKWLKDDYEAAANQPTKQEMLGIVDDMINRLETLSGTSK